MIDGYLAVKDRNNDMDDNTLDNNQWTRNFETLLQTDLQWPMKYELAF